MGPQNTLIPGRARAIAAGLLTIPVLSAAPGIAHAQSTPAQTAPAQTSGATPVPVRATAALRTVSRRMHVVSGGSVAVTGYLRPGRAGQTVRLQRWVGRAWRTIAVDRTARNGRYALSHRVTRTGSYPVRVLFAGDAASASAVTGLGQVTVYRRALASYYTIYGGPLACGGRLGYNAMVVAHKSLPCGTRVTVRYRGRTVNAVVRDRGPYVGNREFDLAGAVARKLGFDGVQTVLVSVAR